MTAPFHINYLQRWRIIENTITIDSLQYGQSAQNSDILQFIIDNGIINLNDVQNSMEAMKTEAGIRDVIIPDNCVWILDKIRRLCPFGQYVFMQDGERIRSYVFRTRLYSNCKKQGIVVKSPHKIRKTYGSKLYDSGEVPESFMMEQMGYTDISCLKKHYYYNRMNDEEKRQILNQVKAL